MLRRPDVYDMHEEDRKEYESYAARAAVRLMHLEKQQ
jgi:hypothetical protein